MTRTCRLTLLAFLLGALTLPGSAFGQATRTWISGVGDDVNPCSRTAPCKTWSGAISKTAVGGEINNIDAGGFGSLTITKSMTIKGRGPLASILNSSVPGITINDAASAAGPGTAKVVIHGLDINGAGTTLGTVGIRILSAKSVRIADTEIYNQSGPGILQLPTSLQTRVVISRSDIHDNGIGVFNSPGSNSISFSSQVVRNSDITGNTCGVVVGSNGGNASIPIASSNCGTGVPPAINKTAVTDIFGTGIHDNAFGVFSRGALAVAEIAGNQITGSSSFALRRLDGGAIRAVTPATNVILNNAASDTPSTTTPMVRPMVRR
jgi:hypothetical protein